MLMHLSVKNRELSNLSQNELKLFKCMYHWKDQVAREVNEWRDDICNLNNLIKMCKTREISNYVKFNNKISMMRKDELMKIFSKYNLGELSDISSKQDMDITEEITNDDRMDESESGAIIEACQNVGSTSEKPGTSKSKYVSREKEIDYEFEDVSDDELDDITITVMYDTSKSKPADYEEISDEEMQEELTVNVVKEKQLEEMSEEEVFEIHAPDEPLIKEIMCLRCFELGHPAGNCSFPKPSLQEPWMRTKIRANKTSRRVSNEEYFKKERTRKNDMYRRSLIKRGVSLEGHFSGR